MALLLFLAAFTALAGVFFTGGSVLLIAVFAVAVLGAAALFVKAKPWEHAEQ